MVERVAVVDDEEGILALLRRVLSAPGREVDIYPSAATALAAMRVSRPDVVVTDLRMPGITGTEFIRSIRSEFGSGVGIIVITAFPTLVSDVDRVENGVGAFLRKPFTDLDLLRATVAEVIESSRRLPGIELPESFRRQLDAADAALRRQRASLSRADAVLDQISDAILIADRAGRLLQVNPAAARLLGLDPEECLGRPLRDLRVDAQLRQAILDPGPAADEGSPVDPRPMAARRVFLERSGRTCDVTTAPLVASDGGSAGVFAVIKDVSAEVRVHELKHQYLTVVAHELRTPLTALTNFASVFERVGFVPKTPRQGEMVDGVRRQVQRLEHQIEKLILLARLERGDFTASREPFELGPAIQLAMATSQADARERGIALTVTPPPDGLLARGDADDFRSALFEVVENAVKFTQNGGRVDVGVETAGDEVVVRVVDSGIGIDPRDQQAIFAPFKQLEDSLTRRHAGAGLGLGLARRMLEAVGGSITVASVPGHGSVFSLHIPREPQPREQQPRDRQAAPTSPEAGFKAVSAATEAVSA
jgi:PAS domain S-box-containing protein